MPTPINVEVTSTPWTAPANCTVVIYGTGYLNYGFTAGNVSGVAWPYGGVDISSPTSLAIAGTNANPIVLSAGQQVSAIGGTIYVTGWTV